MPRVYEWEGHRMRYVAICLLLAGLLVPGAGRANTKRAGTTHEATKHSGRIVAVGAHTKTIELEELGAGGRELKRVIELLPDTKIGLVARSTNAASPPSRSPSCPRLERHRPRRPSRAGSAPRRASEPRHVERRARVGVSPPSRPRGDLPSARRRAGAPAAPDARPAPRGAGALVQRDPSRRPRGGREPARGGRHRRRVRAPVAVAGGRRRGPDRLALLLPRRS